MTPERVAQIYAEETGFDMNDEPAALLEFALAIWDEALETAACKVQTFATTRRKHRSGIKTSAIEATYIIRALKLPEE